MHGRRRAASALLERLARGRGRVRCRLSTLSPNLFRVLSTAVEFQCESGKSWFKVPLQIMKARWVNSISLLAARVLLSSPTVAIEFAADLFTNSNF